MKRIYNQWVFLSAIALLVACGKDDNSTAATEPTDILESLESIPGITVTELEATDHFERLFEIMIEQPVDHNNPDGATFNQKVFLGHVDLEMPVAFETEGYARSSNRTRELSDLFRMNQIGVEHRYCGESVPSPLDWQYLTVWQAANDHHRIVEIFKELYPKAWVSSGASKGGDAAIFHQRFFPDDVEATVAYVAPILFEARDVRFLDFYNQAGDEACREKMKAFQRMMLENIEEFPPLFEEYVATVNNDFGTNLTFSTPYVDIVYHSIREDYAFEFWSSEFESCATIPGENATIQELFNHYVGVFDIFLFFSDWGVEFWKPWYYQSLTEIGNYAYDADHLTDLTMDIDQPIEFDAPTEFRPEVMADIYSWFQSSGSNTILIYGEDDPWTVAPFESQNESVLTIINPGSKHLTDISSLSAENRTLIVDKLNEWMKQ